jgi:hypothetical protein
MKTQYQAALLALTLSAVSLSAFAGRDESLIQQTRKNQLAHDARAAQESKQKQVHIQQQQPAPVQASAPAPAAPTGHDAGSGPLTAPQH